MSPRRPRSQRPYRFDNPLGPGEGRLEIPRSDEEGFLVMPLPPSINSYHRSVVVKGQSRVLISAKGRDWRKSAQVAAAMQWKGAPLEGEVLVRCVVYLPDKRRDLDNIYKPLGDVLQGICYNDDRQLSLLVMEKRVDRGAPRVEVRVADYMKLHAQLVAGVLDGAAVYAQIEAEVDGGKK